MKLKLNRESQRSFELIQHISMESKDSVRNVLRGFLFHVLVQYLKKEPIYLPFIGELRIVHQGDEFVVGGKKAKLDITLTPDENLTRLVGKVIDQNTDELVELVQAQIHEKLGEYLDA